MQLPPQAYTKETLIQAYNWLRSQPAHVQELAKSPDALVSLFTKSQIHGESYLSRTNLQGFKSELKNLAHIMGDLDSTSNEQQAVRNSVSSNNKQLTPSANSNLQSNLHANSHTNSHTNAQSASQSSSHLNHSNPSNTNSTSGTHSQSLGANSSTGYHSTSGVSVSPNESQGGQSSISNSHSLVSSSKTNGSNAINNPMSPMLTEPSYPLFQALMANQQAQEPQDLRTLIDSRSWGMLQEVKNHLNLSTETEALRLLISLGYQKIRPQF